jgi:hypothetical protein
MIPTPFKIYAILAALGLLALSYLWVDEHGKRIAREQDVAAGAEQYRVLSEQYAQSEKTWREKLRAAEDKADASQKSLDDLASRTPTFSVRADCPTRQKLPAAAAAGTGSPKVSAASATAGVLPGAPNPATPESGISGITDAGPGLRADALICDAMSVQLNYWLDRYEATHH